MREVKKGEMYYADLSPVVGSEQGGIRPVIILQNDKGNRYSPTTIIASVTSRKKKSHLPTHIKLKHYRLKSVGFGAKAPIIATESRCQSKDLFARLKVCLSSTQVAVIPLP